MRNKKGQFKKGIIPANKKDLTGKRFGNLVAIEREASEWTKGRTKYLCRCDCGKTTTVDGSKLSSGHTKSCGCLKRKIKDIKNQKFGRATAIRHIGSNKFGLAEWLCKCSCGREFVTAVNNLITGRTQSCGCLRIDNHRKKMKEKREDLTGNRYGLWTVLKRSKKYKILKGIEVGYFWECLCDCGTKKEIQAGSLKNGDSQSCGCVNHTLPPKEYNYPKSDKEKMRLYRKYLTNAAVKAALRNTGYLNSEITTEAIEFKRQQLTMYRTLKQFKEWRKDYESGNRVVSAK